MGGKGQVGEADVLGPVCGGVAAQVQELAAIVNGTGLNAPRRWRSGRVGRVEFEFEPFQVGVDADVTFVSQRRRREKGVGPGGFDAATQREMLREEVMGFGAGMADAGLEVEDGYARRAGLRKAGMGEEPDGEGIGLRMIGANQGKEGRFT